MVLITKKETEFSEGTLCIECKKKDKQLKVLKEKIKYLENILQK